MDSTIQIRIDRKLKKDVQKVLKNLGLDFSSAVKVYFRQINVVQGIPFELRTLNGYTLAQERKILKEIEWAKKHGKSYSSAEALHRDILGE